MGTQIDFYCWTLVFPHITKALDQSSYTHTHTHTPYLFHLEGLVCTNILKLKFWKFNLSDIRDLFYLEDQWTYGPNMKGHVSLLSLVTYSWVLVLTRNRDCYISHLLLMLTFKLDFFYEMILPIHPSLGSKLGFPMLGKVCIIELHTPSSAVTSCNFLISPLLKADSELHLPHFCLWLMIKDHLGSF